MLAISALRRSLAWRISGVSSNSKGLGQPLTFSVPALADALRKSSRAKLEATRGGVEPMVCGTDPDSVTMGSVSAIRIRLAQLSDHDQLLRFREALWPNAPTEEHARELTLILEG